MRTLLRALIDERSWQYATFRHRFENAAREIAANEQCPSIAAMSVSESTYERWCTGQVRPHPPARRVLEHMFGYSVDELLAPPPETLPTRHTGDLSRAEQGLDTNEMGRMAAMAATRALRWALGQDTQVGAETMGHVEGEVGRLAAAYPRVPLPEILSDLVEVQDLTHRILEGGKPSPGQARDLYLMAAITSGMLAKASHDLGDPASAMRQARAAYICAEQAGHVNMQAWVRGLQSLVAYWAGRPEDARHYARDGAHIARSATGSVAVWLPALEARAASVLGDSEGVVVAVSAAEAARERVEQDDLDQLGGILTFGRARQLYYGAEAEVLLPEPPHEAERHAQRAVDAYASEDAPDWAWSDQAGARSNLALARLSIGELEGAVEAMHPVLNLPATQRSAGVVISAQRVGRALALGAVRDAGAARDLRAEIDAFSAVTAPRSLPS